MNQYEEYQIGKFIVYLQYIDRSVKYAIYHVYLVLL